MATKEEKEAAAIAKATEKAKKQTEKQAKAEAAAKAKAEKEAEAAVKAEEKAKVSIEEEAKLLGVKKSRVVMTGYKGKKADMVEKETARHKKLVEKRLENRIARAKKVAKMKPIDLRKAALKSRFKTVRSGKRQAIYTDAILRAWIEELDLINSNPKAWNKATKNGTKSYTPGSKKKQTAKDILGRMDLD